MASKTTDDAKRSDLTDGFVENFSKMKLQVERKISESQNRNSDSLPLHFDDIKRDVQEMQKFISESTKFLPPFNVKVALDSVKSLVESIEMEQAKLIPKKKFAFRKTKPASEPARGRDMPDATAKPSKMKVVNLDLHECGFKNLANQKVEKFSSEISGKDVILSGCTDSTIYLYGYPSTVHASELKNCEIFCGPVTTSIFVEGCENCTFHVACQQLRVHATSRSDFYLYVTSRGIIEDCKGLRFASYDWSYPEFESDFERSGLGSQNNWQLIDDFNWLSKDAASPNWTVLKIDKAAESGDRTD